MLYKTINSRWGLCKYLLKDEYVGRSLHYYGEYNPDETEKILSLASGRCLDIGANHGTMSMALLQSGFEVEAWEPQPEIFELVKHNCPGAVVHNAAVGSSMGMAKMPKVHYSSKNNFGGLGLNSYSIYGYYDVPLVTIDSYEFTDVGFIKLDVEGYELEALKGARETILTCKPVLYVEDDRTNKSAELRKYITGLGYDITEHQPELYRENNFFNHKQNVWDKIYASHNIICTPV